MHAVSRRLQLHGSVQRSSSLPCTEGNLRLEAGSRFQLRLDAEQGLPQPQYTADTSTGEQTCLSWQILSDVCAPHAGSIKH